MVITGGVGWSASRLRSAVVCRLNTGGIMSKTGCSRASSSFGISRMRSLASTRSVRPWMLTSVVKLRSRSLASSSSNESTLIPSRDSSCSPSAMKVRRIAAVPSDDGLALRAHSFHAPSNWARSLVPNACTNARSLGIPPWISRR